GGLTAAALLTQEGFGVKIYEQARAFANLGAGIHLGPNLMQVLRKVGVADEVIRAGVSPEHWISRNWNDGKVLLDVELGADAERRYGEPYIMVHRGTFHANLAAAVPESDVEFGKRLVDLT